MKRKLLLSTVLVAGLCGVGFAEDLKCDSKEVLKALQESEDVKLKIVSGSDLYLNFDTAITPDVKAQKREYFSLLKQEPQNIVAEFNNMKPHTYKKSQIPSTVFCEMDATIYHKDQPNNTHTLKNYEYTVKKADDGTIQIK